MKLPDPDNLYLITTRGLCSSDDYLGHLDALLGAGVNLLQMREKDLSRAELLDLGRALRKLTYRHQALFIVNDDPHLAVELAADGVHVGQDDMAPEEVRGIVGPEMLIGWSTHDAFQIDAAALHSDVDMVGIGPIFATTTKVAGPPLGTRLLRYAADHHPELKAWGIGGICHDNLRSIVASGCRRVAVSTHLLACENPRAAASRMIRDLLL